MKELNEKEDKENPKVFTKPSAGIDPKMHLLLSTGQLLIENGADSARTVRDVTRAAAFMGIPKEHIQQHVMYTTLMLNINDGKHSYTEFRKCVTHSVNMTTLSAISQLTWRAIAQNYSLQDYAHRLDVIRNRERNYPVWLMALGAGAACGGFCKLFGGSWLDFLLTAVCAMLGFLLCRHCARYGINIYAVIAITSFVTTMLAWSTQFLTGSLNWYPLIACTLFLVPGTSLINAVNDLLNNFIVSGMTRTMHALLVVGSMTFGIVTAIRLGGVTDFTNVSLTPDTIYLSQAIAAAVASAGFSIIFNVPKRLLPLVAVGGIITVMLRNVTVLELGWSQAVGSFFGAAVVRVLTLRAFHWFHTPNITMTIPSVIPMIPGVLLYRLLFALLNIQFITSAALTDGIRSGVMAIIIIIGIAAGVAIPNIFMYRYIQRSKLEREQLLLAQQPAELDD